MDGVDNEVRNPKLLHELYAHTLRYGRLHPALPGKPPIPPTTHPRRLRRLRLDEMVLVRTAKEEVEVEIGNVTILCRSTSLERFVKKYVHRVEAARNYFTKKRVFKGIDPSQVERFIRRYSLFSITKLFDDALQRSSDTRKELAKCLLFEVPELAAANRAYVRFQVLRKARRHAHQERMREAVRKRLRHRSPETIRMRI